MLVDLVNHRAGAMISFVVNSPKIFSDNTQHDNDQAKQERNQSDDRGKPGDLAATEKCSYDNQRTVTKTQQGNYKADQGDQADRDN